MNAHLSKSNNGQVNKERELVNHPQLVLVTAWPTDPMCHHAGIEGKDFLASKVVTWKHIDTYCVYILLLKLYMRYIKDEQNTISKKKNFLSTKQLSFCSF